MATPAVEPPLPQLSPPKKEYQSPSLLEWGSLVELTGGPFADIQDDDFTGSGSI